MSLSQYIWFEKYRPKTIKEVSLKPAHKQAFESYIDSGNIPHLLLSGPAGSGKSTCAYILMNTIPCVTLTLNASGQDRGIDTVKGKITQFAASQPPKDKIKIILLDEADQITAQAQGALRNTMETHSNTCRFILTCNYPDKIIPAIHSRCTPFTFDLFPKKKVQRLCNDILAKEGIDTVDQDELSTLIDKYYPDIRSVINNTQMACISGSFDLKSLGQSTCDPSEVINIMLSGKVLSLRNYIAGVTDYTFLYKFLFNHFMQGNYKNEDKGSILTHIADIAARDSIVPDREINFISCCLPIMEVIGVKANFKG